MKNTIRLLFILLICGTHTIVFGQIPKKEISKKLTKKTLKSIDNPLISNFLKDFAKVFEKGNWEDLKSVFSDEYCERYFIRENEASEKYDSDIELQRLFLTSSIYTFLGEQRFYGDYMREFYTLEDWTTVKKVHYTKFIYEPVTDERLEDYWIIKTVFITKNDEYYLGSIICRIDKTRGKIVFVEMGW